MWNSIKSRPYLVCWLVVGGFCSVAVGLDSNVASGFACMACSVAIGGLVTFICEQA